MEGIETREGIRGLINVFTIIYFVVLLILTVFVAMQFSGRLLDSIILML